MSARGAPRGDDLVLDALATYRITRLLTMDDLTKPIRDRVWKWAADREHHRLAEFVTCPHCVGVWVAGGVVLLGPRVQPRRAWRALRLTLAVAGAESLLATVANALES